MKLNFVLKHAFIFILAIMLVFTIIMPILALDTNILENNILVNEFLDENETLNYETDLDKLDIEKNNMDLDSDLKNEVENNNVVKSNYENIETENLETQNFIGINSLANTILPAGSTSDDLQEALNNASSGDTIILTSDVMYTSTTSIITTLYDTDVTIQSDEGNNWKLIQTNPSTRHFEIIGGLTIQNITLDGGGIGGGIRLTYNHFTMNTGAIIQNCYSGSGGALSLSQGTRFIMNDGLITNNAASGSGRRFRYLWGILYVWWYYF